MRCNKLIFATWKLRETNIGVELLSLILDVKSKENPWEQPKRHDLYECDRVSMTSLCSTAAPDCCTSQSKGKYHAASIPVVVVGNNQSFFHLHPKHLAFCSERISGYKHKNVSSSQGVSLQFTRRLIDVRNLASICYWQHEI